MRRRQTKAQVKKTAAQRLAAEQEEARLVEEARLEEENLRQRLAAESVERLRAPRDTDEEKYLDLVKWISNIPLTKPESDRTDRAFSDGVLIAELIEYYAPDICNRKEFFKAYSTRNKLVNWNHLNLKVFPLLGFRLKEENIKNIISPLVSLNRYDNPQEHPLFQLLFKLQIRLGEMDPSLYEYRRKDKGESGVPFRTPSFKGLNLKKSDLPTYSKIELEIGKHGMAYFSPIPECCPCREDLFMDVCKKSSCMGMEKNLFCGVSTHNVVPPSTPITPMEGNQSWNIRNRCMSAPHFCQYQRDSMNYHFCQPP